MIRYREPLFRLAVHVVLSFEYCELKDFLVLPDILVNAILYGTDATA